MSKNPKGKDAIQVINNILSTAQADKGLVYLRKMAENLCKESKAKFILVGEAVGADKRTIQTRVVWSREGLMDNITYSLDTTPCDKVMTGHRVCSHPKNVTMDFPDDILLQDMEIEGYIGCPILTPDEDLIGLLVLLDDKELDADFPYNTCLDFCASRAGLEFEREKYESELKRLNKDLEEIVSNRTKELKKSNDELSLINKEMNRFVAIVSHDLRSPISYLISAHQILDKDIEAIKNLAPGMKRATVKSFDLIKDILDIAAIRSGHLKIELKENNFNDLVSSCFEELEGIAKNKGIELVQEVDKTDLVYCDGARISQVLGNLITNSIKFSHKGDKVIIKSSVKGEDLKISVVDTGIGISDNLLPDLFKKEVKTTTKGTSGESGTGFGLPLSQEILLKHDSIISVNSNPKIKTDFSFYLKRSA